jgi:hypothetical protein
MPPTLTRVESSSTVGYGYQSPSDPPFWRLMSAASSDEVGTVCSFCGLKPDGSARLVVGRHASICGGCLEQASRLSGGHITVYTGPYRPIGAKRRRRATCSFCGKDEDQVAR